VGGLLRPRKCTQQSQVWVPAVNSIPLKVKTMKKIFALLFSFTALAVAQDSEPVKAKRVASVTWDLQTHKLIWVVQNGVAQDGEFMPSSSEERYEISPEHGAMAFEGEQRGVAVQEAAWLQQLLNVLTVYCAQSVLWWDAGQADREDEEERPAAPTEGKPELKPAPGPDTMPHKVAEPPRRVPGAIQLVARNMIL
jgi:hypothetical protein